MDYYNDAEYDDELTQPSYSSTLKQRYQNYLLLADDGTGRDQHTSNYLMTFDEWLNNT